MRPVNLVEAFGVTEVRTRRFWSFLLLGTFNYRLSRLLQNRGFVSVDSRLEGLSNVMHVGRRGRLNSKRKWLLSSCSLDAILHSLEECILRHKRCFYHFHVSKFAIVKLRSSKKALNELLFFSRETPDLYLGYLWNVGEHPTAWKAKSVLNLVWGEIVLRLALWTNRHYFLRLNPMKVGV